MMRVMDIGCAGYIGSHTCKELKASGFDPVAFDNLSEGHAEFVKWGELIEGDIRNPADIAAALERVQPVAAIHFAAHACVGQSVTDPSIYYQNSVTGSINVAQARQRLSFVPQDPDLDTIVRTAVAWHRARSTAPQPVN